MFLFFEKNSARSFRKEKLIAWITNTYWEDPVNQERTIKLIEKIKLADDKIHLLDILTNEATTIPNIFENKKENEDTRYYDAIDRIYGHYVWNFCMKMLQKNLINQHMMGDKDNNQKPWGHKDLSILSDQIMPEENAKTVYYNQAKNILIKSLKQAIWDDAINLKRAIDFTAKIDAIDPTKIYSGPSFQDHKAYSTNTQIAYELVLELANIKKNIQLDPNNNFPAIHNDCTRYYDFLRRIGNNYDMDASPGLMICSGLVPMPERDNNKIKLYKKYEEYYEPAIEKNLSKGDQNQSFCIIF